MQVDDNYRNYNYSVITAHNNNKTEEICEQKLASQLWYGFVLQRCCNIHASLEPWNITELLDRMQARRPRYSHYNMQAKDDCGTAFGWWSHEENDSIVPS